MDARFVPALGGIVLVALLAGCGSTPKTSSGTFNPSGTTDTSSPSAISSDSPATAAPAPSAMTTPEFTRSVLSGYRAYQAAYERAYETNDPSGLGQYATDPILSLVEKDIEAGIARGEIWRFHNVLNPRLQGWTPDRTTVAVLDCLQTLGSYRYNAKSGKRLGSGRAVNGYYQAQMRYVAGTWKIFDAKVGKRC
jgi:hypothetical protein